MPNEFGLAANNCCGTLGNRDFTRNPIHHRLEACKKHRHPCALSRVQIAGFRLISAISNPLHELPSWCSICNSGPNFDIFRIGACSFGPA